MPPIETALWSLNLPAGWETEADAEGMVCYDPAAAGSLLLSASAMERRLDDDFLRHLASDHLEAGAQAEPLVCGDFQGFELSYADAERFWREWYLRADATLLFVTYQCPLDEEGQQDLAIDAILESLQAR